MDIFKYIMMDFLTIVVGFAAGFLYRKWSWKGTR